MTCVPSGRFLTVVPPNRLRPRLPGRDVSGIFGTVFRSGYLRRQCLLYTRPARQEIRQSIHIPSKVKSQFKVFVLRHESMNAPGSPPKHWTLDFGRWAYGIAIIEWPEQSAYASRT